MVRVARSAASVLIAAVIATACSVDLGEPAAPSVARASTELPTATAAPTPTPTPIPRATPGPTTESGEVTEPDAGEAAAAPGSSFGEVMPAPKRLPPAFSTIQSVGTEAGYYAADDGEMQLVVFDPDSGSGKYQLAAHPLGRIRGVGQGILVDDELGLIFMTKIEDPADDRTASLVALDAETGDVAWRAPIDYYSAQPIACGDHLCVRSMNQVTVVDSSTGSTIETIDATDRRLLINEAHLWVASATDSASDTAAFTSLEASEPATNSRLWSISADELSEAAGMSLDPSFGWRGDYDETTGAMVIWLASDDGEFLVGFGIDAAGQIRWSRTDLDPCISGPVLPRFPVVCRFDPETAQFTSIARLDAETGDPVWHVPLEPGFEEFSFDGAAVVAWQWINPDYTVLAIDGDTGDVAPLIGPAICSGPTTWATFTYPDGVQAGWSSSTNYAICRPDGWYLDRDAAMAAAAELPASGASFWLVDGDGVPLTRVGD